MYVLASLITAETLEHLWQHVNSIDPMLAMLVVFVLLFLAGCGLPMPEDIPLTFSGILLGLPTTQVAFGGLFNSILLVGVLCYTSILAGDLVAYELGRRYGRTLSRYRPFKWAMPERRIARLDRWFEKFGNWTVFFGRMVAGIRFVTFATAGMTRMPLRKFILFDSLAALVTVPAWIILGYILGTHFSQIVEWMSRISTTTWIILGALATVFVIYKLYRSWARRRSGRQQV